MNKPAAFLVFLLLPVSAFVQTDSAAIYRQKAQEEKARGRKLEVTKALEKAYAFGKTNADIVTELGYAYLDIRMLANARTKFLEAESLGNKTLSLYKQLMELSFNMHKYEDAIRFAQLVKKAGPKEKVAFVIAKSYYDQQEWSKSIPHFEVAAREDTANADIHFMLGKAQFNLESFAKAVPHFEQAIRKQPNNARWLFDLALVYYNLGDDDNAWNYLVEAGEKALKQDKDYIHNLAAIYYNAGKFEESMKVLREVLADKPDDLELLEFVGDFCYNAQRYDDAITYYSRVFDLDSTKASVLFMVGLSYQKKGEKEKGKQICERAMALDPRLRRSNRGMRM